MLVGTPVALATRHVLKRSDRGSGLFDTETCKLKPGSLSQTGEKDSSTADELTCLLF